MGAATGKKCQLGYLCLEKIGWVRAPVSVEMQSHQLRCDEVDRYAQIQSGMLFSIIYR